jgi:hypothetical protein
VKLSQKWKKKLIGCKDREARHLAGSRNAEDLDSKDQGTR